MIIVITKKEADKIIHSKEIEISLDLGITTSKVTKDEQYVYIKEQKINYLN